MLQIRNISVIIPSNHVHGELLILVQALINQTIKPNEIVIVDSSVQSGICPPEIVNLCCFKSIQLTYVHRERALPGEARNIGLSMIGFAEFIAFIDVQTIPRQDWLESSLTMINDHEAAGVWGATCFSAETKFEKLVRDAFYGVKPRRTLPGSVFRCEVFNQVGQFIDWVRAGEDTEWILRSRLLNINVVISSSALVDYVGLLGSNYEQLLHKWYRNYFASRDLPHFYPQRLLLWLILYPLIVLLAFNWNYLVADWRMDSPLYLGHITKVVATFPLMVYLVVRGVMLPKRRGVKIEHLLPTRFIAITLICLIADTVKFFVFSIPNFKKYIYRKSLDE